MAIAFVAAGAVATGTSPNVTVPAGYAEGNLLVIVSTGSNTPTTPTGWTQRYAQGAGRNITVLTKYAGSTEATVSGFGTLGIPGKAVMLCYSGAGSYDVVGTVATGTSTSAATVSQTTTYNNDFIISIFARTTTASTFTVPASTTSRVNSSSTGTINGLLLVDELQATAGASAVRTSTLSVSGAWAAINISFVETRTLYWVGGAGTWNTTTTGNWALSSGGSATGILPPVANEPVNIDTSSGTGTITCTAGVCGNLSVTASQAIVLGALNSTLLVFGNLSFPSGGSFSASTNVNSIYLAAGSAKTITTNGKSFSSLIFDGVGGNWTLPSAVTVTSAAFLDRGTITLSTNTTTLTCAQFSSGNSNTRAIAFGTGNITTTGSGTAFNTSTATNLTYTGTPTVNISNNSSNVTTVTAHTTGGTAANAFNFNFTTGTYSLTLTSSARVGSLNFTGFAGSWAPTGGTSAVIYGDLTLVSGMTFTSSSATFTFAATSGVQLITSAGKTLTNITQNGVGGTVRLAAGTTLLSSRTYTLTNGTLDLATNTATLSTGTFSSNNANIRQIQFGTGAISVSSSWDTNNVTNFTYTGTPTVNVSGFSPTVTAHITSGTASNALDFNVSASGTFVLTTDSIIRSLDFTGSTGTWAPANSSIYTFYGNLTLASGMTLTLPNNLTFNFSATSGTQTITSAGKSMRSITQNGVGGTVSLGDALSLLETYTLTNGTFTANNQNITLGTSFSSSNSNTIPINMGSGTWTLSGSGSSWLITTTNLTFNRNTSTIVLSDTSTTAKTFAGSNLTYYDLTLGAGAGITTYTITGANTFNTLAVNKTVESTIILPVATTTATTLSFNGSSGNILYLTSSTPGTQTTLNVTNAFTANYLYVYDNTLSSSNGTVTNGGITNSTGWTSGAGSSFFKLLDSTTPNSFTVPSSWDNSNNAVHIIGAGGGGGGGTTVSAEGGNSAAGGGGGGGGYAKLINQSYTVGQTITYVAGQGGTLGGGGGNLSTSTGGTGGTTYWNTSTPVTYVSSQISVQSTNATTIVVTRPAYSSGNLMIMIVVSDSDTNTWTTPAGWTAGTNAANGRAVFYKTAGGSEASTYTVTQSSSRRSNGTILVYSGAKWGGSGANTGSSTSVTPTTTATLGLSTIIYCGFGTNASQVFSTPTGYTLRQSASGTEPPSTYVFELSNISTSPYTAPTSTVSGGNPGRAFLVSVDPTTTTSSIYATGGTGGASSTVASPTLTSTGGTGGTGTGGSTNYTGGNGGVGGASGTTDNAGGGGGGSAGPNGNGGNGGNGNSTNNTNTVAGGGGGGNGGGSAGGNASSGVGGAGGNNSLGLGGGVAPGGSGSNGGGGAGNVGTNNPGGNGGSGTDIVSVLYGTGGGSGGSRNSNTTASAGLYGGGGGGAGAGSISSFAGDTGAQGAIVLVWGTQAPTPSGPEAANFFFMFN